MVLALGLPLLLLACGSPPSRVPAVTRPGPYADGQAYFWTSTSQEGSRLLSSFLSGLRPQGVNLNLGLTLTATNGWGPIEVGTSNGEQRAGDGKPITLGGVTFPAGLGVHADSEIHIQATGLVTPACTRFRADIGIDDEVGTLGSVVFQVYADHQKLYDSGVMTGSSPTQSIDVAIGNRSDLRFVVNDGGDNNFYDHADWANARLECPTPPPTFGVSGTLDLSFNNDGRVDLPGLAKFVKVLQQPDGKLLAVTEDRGNTAQLRRYSANGRLDAAFGQQGSVSLPANLVPREAAFAPDGKVVVAGIFSTGDTYFISRFLSDGRLDSSFGNTGLLSVHSDQVSVFFVVQPNGKMVVATGEVERPNDFSNPGFQRIVLTRYSANGAPDSSFGQAGRVIVNSPPSAVITPLEQLRDGRLLVSFYGAGGVPALARYSADGRPDASFGQAGTVLVRFAAGEGASVGPVAEQADGKLLVAGLTSSDSTGLSTVAVARYLPDGQIDPSFGDSGVLKLPRDLIVDASSPVLLDSPVEVQVQADGPVLVAMRNAGVVRLTTAGRVDISFGDSGVVKPDIADQYLNNILIQTDGKLLLNVSVFVTPEAGYLLRFLP